MVLTPTVEPGLRVRSIRSEQQVSELREVWNSLNARSSEGTIFSTWEWCTAAWKHLGKSCQPFVIVVEDGADVVGIAPLVIDSRWWPVRVVWFMGHGSLGRYASAGYCAFIAAPGRHESVLCLVLDALMKHSREWDVVDLFDVPSYSSLITCMPEKLEQRGLPHRLERQGTSHRVDLPDTWQSYLSGLSANTRGNIGRRLRKLEREHAVRFEHVTEGPRLADRLQILFALQSAKWQGQPWTGAFPTEQHKRFHLDVAPAFLDKGWLALTVLWADDVPVGAIYNLVYRGIVYEHSYAFQTSEDWHPYSLGNVLISDAVKHAIDEGMTAYDMAGGFDKIKLPYGSRPMEVYRIQIATRHSSHRLYAATRSLRGKAISLRVGLKDTRDLLDLRRWFGRSGKGATEKWRSAS